MYIYIYIKISSQKATCVVVNVSKYKNTLIFQKYFGCSTVRVDKALDKKFI